MMVPLPFDVLDAYCTVKAAILVMAVTILGILAFLWDVPSAVCVGVVGYVITRWLARSFRADYEAQMHAIAEHMMKHGPPSGTDLAPQQEQPQDGEADAED